RLDALTVAIFAHEKGFYLRNDYYNGINFAFLLDCRAAELGGDDAIADRVQARRVRERVVGICTRLLAEGIKGENEHERREQRILGSCNARRSSARLGKHGQIGGGVCNRQEHWPQTVDDQYHARAARQTSRFATMTGSAYSVRHVSRRNSRCLSTPSGRG